MGLHDEVWSRYQSVHESHCQYRERRAWMHRYAALSVFPHLPPPPAHVLEIACGAGDMMAVVRDAGYTTLGTDLCPENVRGGVLMRDVFKDPLPEQFDAIIAQGIIEHLHKEELLPALRAVKSMLKPGAAVQFHTQNMDARIGVHYRYLDITHELGFTRESLAQVGRLVFDDVAVYPMVYPPPEGWRARLAQRVWKRLYRKHLEYLGDPVQDSWWDVIGLVGVFRA